MTSPKLASPETRPSISALQAQGPFPNSAWLPCRLSQFPKTKPFHPTSNSARLVVSVRSPTRRRYSPRSKTKSKYGSCCSLDISPAASNRGKSFALDLRDSKPSKQTNTCSKITSFPSKFATNSSRTEYKSEPKSQVFPSLSLSNQPVLVWKRKYQRGISVNNALNEGDFDLVCLCSYMN